MLTATMRGRKAVETVEGIARAARAFGKADIFSRGAGIR